MKRFIANLFGLGLAGPSAWSEASESLRRWADEQNLVVVNHFGNAFDCQGRRLGWVRPGTHLAVAPDGRTIAFTRRRDPTSRQENVVILMGEDGVEHPLIAPGSAIARLAISSNQHVAALIARGSNVPKTLELIYPLVLVDDLSFVFSTVGGGKTETLQFSSDGALVAVGTRESFVIVDLASRETIFAARGRFPMLSPNGRMLAFVGPRSQLTLQELNTSTVTRPLPKVTALGIGTWSPDGRYLLVGRPVGVFANQLDVVDIGASTAVATLWRMGEGNFGSRSIWISRKFVRPDREDD